MINCNKIYRNKVKLNCLVKNDCAVDMTKAKLNVTKLSIAKMNAILAGKDDIISENS